VGGEGKGGEEEANVFVLPIPDETDSIVALEVSNHEIGRTRRRIATARGQSLPMPILPWQTIFGLSVASVVGDVISSYLLDLYLEF
jgi:hypothetical protein